MKAAIIANVAKSYRWNDANLDHATKHGITPKEAQQVVNRARTPYPRYIGDGKWLVWGQTTFGEYMQVIYVEDPAPPETVYIIHARSLDEREKRLYRRQQR